MSQETNAASRFRSLLASERRSADFYSGLADAGLYQGDPDATAAMAVDERSHARVLTRLRTTDDPSGIRKVERWHRGDRSGALRAAVFGVNDGLVSNSSLVMGFAGSGAANTTIAFAGLAGAFSMAADTPDQCNAVPGAHRVRRAGVHALRSNGWSRPSQACATAVAQPENDWLH